MQYSRDHSAAVNILNNPCCRLTIRKLGVSLKSLKLQYIQLAFLVAKMSLVRENICRVEINNTYSYVLVLTLKFLIFLEIIRSLNKKQSHANDGKLILLNKIYLINKTFRLCSRHNYI
jgi:hypothetical protein